MGTSASSWRLSEITVIGDDDDLPVQRPLVLCKVVRTDGKVSIADAVSGRTVISIDEDAYLILINGDPTHVSDLSDVELLQHLRQLGMLNIPV